jgi:type I restriction enzyme R subunit
VSGFESVVEEATLGWFEELGYQVRFGADVAPGEPAAERDGFGEVVLTGRLCAALRKLNPEVPDEGIEDAFRKLVRPAQILLVDDNSATHHFRVNGVTVEYLTRDGAIRGDVVRVVDFDEPDKNDWLVVNQFTVVEGQHKSRPDLVVFLNGLPVAVIELKSPTDEDATIWTAFQQLQTYKERIPSLFAHNEILVISDGLLARLGSLTSDRERFAPWRTIEGEDLAPASLTQLEVLLRGVFDKRRLLDLLRFCVAFEDDGETKLKKLAGYHQFHAVRRAVEATAAASRIGGDRRGGVVWHTQGSGKSLTMAFYAGWLVVDPRLENPTIVVLTDRNDLDDQLFGTFSRCRALIRQDPEQAEDRADLRRLLQVAAGGVVFSTIQKFFPEEKGDRHPLLSERRNIVVIADEAHRSQYDFIDGFARHMRDALPNATFIGFTGTPIEQADKNTPAVFGDYISVYDIQRAVEDGATVPILYEGRYARLDLDASQKPRIDEDFEEATEGEEAARKEQLKTKWAALEAVVGAERRVKLIARDLVEHFENRLGAMAGKAMVVCMSRRICVGLYGEIAALRPAWAHPDDDQGAIKVVMTGTASETDWQEHIRNKKRREALARRFKDPSDPLLIVLVRDMWLTGFDAPCLHTMYIDKPMRGHGLMQAIARVNRVFRDKPGGLVVDYLGLADQLRQALAEYTEAGGKGRTSIDQAEAVAVMLEKHEVCCDLFVGFDRSPWTRGSPAERVTLLPAAQDFVLASENGKQRLVQAVTELSKAFALAVPHEEALRIRDDVAFFQAVKAALVKTAGESGRSQEDLDLAVRQIVARAIAGDDVIDIFAAAGLKSPDISILSDEFLAEVRGMEHKNLAAELLRKLLADEIRTRGKRNLVQSRSFAEMLEAAVRKYHNRAVETVEVIEELIRLAKEIRAAQGRGEELGLNDDEVAFYDALEVNDSAVNVLGDAALRTIARELVQTVKGNVTIDWTVRETVRARLRVLVKRVLRKHGYPPDKQEKATQTVLAQAELLCEGWAA